MSTQQNTQGHIIKKTSQPPALPPESASENPPHNLPNPASQQDAYPMAQQQHLMETAAQFLAASTPDELWPIMITAVKTILAADRAAIFLYDTTQNTATSPASHGLSESYLKKICDLVLDAPSHELWTNRQPILIDDISDDPRTDLVSDLMQQEGLRTCAIFPLITADRHLLGSIIAYRNSLKPFSAQDSAAGQTLAHMSALALQNIQHFSETRLNLIREQHLNNFSRSLASATDLPAILGQVIYTAAHIAGADAALLGLVIDHQVMTFYPYNIPTDIVLRPLPRGRGLAWQVVQENSTIHLHDYPSHYMAQDRWIHAGVTGLVGVPITGIESPLGTLILLTLRPSQKQFTQREIALIESIGHQAGIAIQNSRMFAEATQRTTALRNALHRQAELDDMKNKFVQNVSHELRTPLGIIHGHAELLGAEALGKLQPRQADSINIIQRRVQMLIDLVNDLTAILAAETQELRREEINPAFLAYDVIEEYRLQAKDANIHLHAEIEDELPTIVGDLTHLRRVFDNLIANAFKFTAEEGTVTIRVWEEAAQIYIEVADTGIGIPADQLQHVFDRFYQVDGKSARRYPGTGLGLALVKEIVEAHRGRVAVTSEEGVGTTFQIILPATTS